MHMPCRFLLASLLVSALLGCNPRAMQRAAALNYLHTLRSAASRQDPLPAPSQNSDSYGIYKPLLDCMYTHGSKLRELNQDITKHSKEGVGALKPESLADPATRQASHTRLKALASDFEQVGQELEAMVGPSFDKTAHSLVPEDPAFIDGVIEGVKSSRESAPFVQRLFTEKQEYYQRIDDLVTLADRSLVGLDSSGKLLFRSPEASAEYSSKLHELVAFEQTMNVDARKYQAFLIAAKAQ